MIKVGSRVTWTSILTTGARGGLKLVSGTVEAITNGVAIIKPDIGNDLRRIPVDRLKLAGGENEKPLTGIEGLNESGSLETLKTIGAIVNDNDNTVKPIAHKCDVDAAIGRTLESQT